MTPHVSLRPARPLLVTVLAAATVAAGVSVVATRPAAGSTAALTTVRLVSGSGTRDVAGASWRTDRGYATGGRLLRIRQPIAKTRNAKLFRTVRYGKFGYRIPVRPGVYAVTINTVATSKAAVGRAPFAVRANGVTTVAKVEALRRAGVRRAYSANFMVTVRSNKLALTFPGRRGGAVTSVAVIGRRPLPVVTPVSRPTTRPTPPPTTTAIPAPPPPTSAPTTAAPSTPPSGPPVETVAPESFGARGDGTTDDAAALRRTFAAAAGRPVVLTAGRTYAFGSVLAITVVGLHLTGAGTLLALDEEHSSVLLDADRITVDGGVTIRTRATTQRWGTFDQMGVRLGAHTGITLRDVTVVGSAAAGVYVGGSDHFTLDRVTVQDTRADGIHLTYGASYGTVTSPTVINSGDDGVAIVSYKGDGTPVHDITVTSPRVLGTTWGRGLSVVGGRNITETDVYVADTSAAGVYIGAEGDPWYTAAPVNVTITGGTILRANRTTTVEHGAVLVLSAANDVVPDTITVKGLTIRDTVFKWRSLSVITYGALPRNLLFQDITITGQSGYGGNTAQSAYRLRNIILNGARQADQG